MRSRDHLRLSLYGLLFLLLAAWRLYPFSKLPELIQSTIVLSRESLQYGTELFLFYLPMYILNFLTLIPSGIAGVLLICVFVHRRHSRFLHAALYICLAAEIPSLINMFLYGSSMLPLHLLLIKLIPLILLLPAGQWRRYLASPDGISDQPETRTWPFLHEFALYKKLADEELNEIEEAEKRQHEE